MKVNQVGWNKCSDEGRRRDSQAWTGDMEAKSEQRGHSPLEAACPATILFPAPRSHARYLGSSSSSVSPATRPCTSQSPFHKCTPFLLNNSHVDPVQHMIETPTRPALIEPGVADRPLVRTAPPIEAGSRRSPRPAAAPELSHRAILLGVARLQSCKMPASPCTLRRVRRAAHRRTDTTALLPPSPE